MTEAEFQQAQNNGEVNAVQPEQQDPQEQTGIPPFSPDEYQPVLEALRRPRQPLSAVPTFTPKSFADQIQLIDDGVNKKATFFINDMWVTLGDYKKATASANANSVAISGLDLEADKLYKIYLRARDGSTSTSAPMVRLNNSNTNYVVRYNTVGVGNGTLTPSGISVVNSGSGSEFEAELLLSKTAGKHTLVKCEGTGYTFLSPTTAPILDTSAIIFNDTTNITSITFLAPDGTTVFTWDIVIIALTPS
jgi:hypothetical protein